MKTVVIFLLLLNLMVVIGSVMTGNYMVAMLFGFFVGPMIVVTGWAALK